MNYNEINLTDLIADMALKGATKEELMRVVKFTLVVMDASKDFNIHELTRKYQWNDTPLCMKATRNLWHF